MIAPNPKPETPQHTLRMTAFVRLAVDEHGHGPSARTLSNYVNDGVLPAVRDSDGKLLFRASDALTAVQIYRARRVRSGGPGTIASHLPYPIDDHCRHAH